MLTDGRTTDARVTGILIAHLGAFGSGELKITVYNNFLSLKPLKDPVNMPNFYIFNCNIYICC